MGLCGRVWGQVAGAGLGHRLAGSGLQVVSSDGFLLGELNKQFLVLISKSNFLNGFSYARFVYTPQAKQVFSYPPVLSEIAFLNH